MPRGPMGYPGPARQGTEDRGCPPKGRTAGVLEILRWLRMVKLAPADSRWVTARCRKNRKLVWSEAVQQLQGSPGEAMTFLTREGGTAISCQPVLCTRGSFVTGPLGSFLYLRVSCFVFGLRTAAPCTQ